MHNRLTGLYEGCDHDDHTQEDLHLAVPPSGVRGLLKTVEKAFKKLHGRKKYDPGDLAEVPEYREVIRETNAVLSRSLKDNSLSPETLKRMREDVFLFSGLKTHAELFEASRQLLSDDGKIKSFNQFSQDVKGVKESHKRYLEAEYRFAVGSVQQAERWEGFSDDEETYSLQYRTDGGPNVRDSHAALNRTTLPKNDPFWARYSPLNGWNCHCFVKEVLAFRYDRDNSAEAIKKGEKATTSLNKDGKNKAAIFRFNPALKKVVFPPEHPYRKVQDAGKAGEIILTIINEGNKKERKAKDAEVKQWAKENIPQSGKIVELDNFKTGKATVLRKNVRGISDHFTNVELKDIAMDVFKWLKKCDYKSSAKLSDSKIKKSVKNTAAKKARGVTGFNYYQFEWKNETFRLNVEIIDGKEFPFSVNKMTNAE